MFIGPRGADALRPGGARAAGKGFCGKLANDFRQTANAETVLVQRVIAGVQTEGSTGLDELAMHVVQTADLASLTNEHSVFVQATAQQCGQAFVLLEQFGHGARAAGVPGAGGGRNRFDPLIWRGPGVGD